MRGTMLVTAAIVEMAVGYPDWVFRLVGHPVSWAGWLIGRLDEGWNDPGVSEAVRRRRGVAALGIVVGAAWGAGVLVGRAGRPAAVLAASTLLAARSLHEHVAAAADGLEVGLPEGRAALARIVGRDVAGLDEAGVARAAIESLAENFSDGVVAPAFWFAVGGLPLMAAFKAINTADSMIGHLDARHGAFGWAAARLDDWVNLPASRLSAVLLAVGSGQPRAAMRAVRRDARRHRSPNAGWPEAAMAGGLGVRVGGPRSYGGDWVEGAWMGDGRDVVGVAEIRRGLRLLRWGWVLGLVSTGGLAAFGCFGFSRGVLGKTSRV